MSRRDRRWELVDRDGDPVPTTAEDVHDAADDFRERGDVMSEAARGLKSIASGDGWTGESAETFAEAAGKTHRDLDTAASKYTDAARALNEFAHAVGVARDRTRNAIQAAEDADAQRSASSPGDGLPAGTELTDEQRDAETRRSQRHDEAVDALQAAKRRVDEAMEDLDHAAQRAEHAINAASAQFKDTRMDNFRGFVAAAVKVLEVIAVVLAVVIIIVVVVATFGAALGIGAAIVGLAAALAGPLMLAATILGGVLLAAKGFQFFAGDASFSDVVWAAVGVFGGPLIGKLGGRIAAPVLARMTSSAATATAARSSAAAASVAANQRQIAVTAYMLNALDDQGLAMVDDAIRVQQATTVADDVLSFQRGLDTVIRQGETNPNLALSFLAGDAMENTIAHATYLGRNGASMDSLASLYVGLGVQGVGGAAVNTTSLANDFSGFSLDIGPTDQLFEFDAPDRPTSVVPVGR